MGIKDNKFEYLKVIINGIFNIDNLKRIYLIYVIINTVCLCKAEERIQYEFAARNMYTWSWS